MTRNRLYLLSFTLIIAGYGYLWYSFHNSHSSFTPCVFKNITGIACPSCGSTRAVVLLAKGNFMESLYTNPLGIIVAAIMAILPFWMGYDMILNKNSFYNSYLKGEKLLKTKWIFATAIILLSINWSWNIYKNL